MRDLLLSLESLLRHVAEAEVMPRFRHIAAEIKADGSFLTEADLACQRVLASALPKLYPCPVLGEEMPRDQQEQLWRDHQDALWIVDPIDGTTNFSHGLPFFAISVALFQHGRPVLGMVYAPALNECFAAVYGQGSWLNGIALKLELPAVLAETVAAVDTKRLPMSLKSRVVVAPPFHGQRNFGVGTLDWCWVAAGRLDLMLHGGQKLWDYAAGVLILQEAGGEVAGIQSVDFWSQSVWERSVVAARNVDLQKAWVAWVQQNV